MKRSKRKNNKGIGNNNINQEESSSSSIVDNTSLSSSTIRKKRRKATSSVESHIRTSQQRSISSNTSMNNRALRSNTKTSLSVSNHFHNNYRTKTYLCVGCSKRFSQFKSPSQFIKNHMETNIRLQKSNYLLPMLQIRFHR